MAEGESMKARDLRPPRRCFASGQHRHRGVASTPPLPRHMVAPYAHANRIEPMTASPASASSSQLVRRDDDPGVVTLTLAAPQNRNALGLAMIDTLIVAFADIAKDEKARVVVLAGEGPAFSAG